MQIILLQHIFCTAPEQVRELGQKETRLRDARRCRRRRSPAFAPSSERPAEEREGPPIALLVLRTRIGRTRIVELLKAYCALHNELLHLAAETGQGGESPQRPGIRSRGTGDRGREADHLFEPGADGYHLAARESGVLVSYSCSGGMVDTGRRAGSGTTCRTEPRAGRAWLAELSLPSATGSGEVELQLNLWQLRVDGTMWCSAEYEALRDALTALVAA